MLLCQYTKYRYCCCFSLLFLSVHSSCTRRWIPFLSWAFFLLLLFDRFSSLSICFHILHICTHGSLLLFIHSPKFGGVFRHFVIQNTLYIYTCSFFLLLSFISFDFWLHNFDMTAFVSSLFLVYLFKSAWNIVQIIIIT